MVSHTASFYADLVPDRALFQDPLPKDVDVVVLGGGLAGLSTAVSLIERGKSVVLCESQRIGWGASGRNGGFVLPGYAESTSALVAALGPDHGRALYDMSVEGCELVRQRIEAAGRQDVIWGLGGLTLVRHSMSQRDIDETLAEEVALGSVVTHLSQDDLSDYVRSDRYRAGFLSEEGFHINPLAYAEILGESICEKGGLIREATEVIRVTREGTGLTVGTKDGQIRAQDVVFCGSGYLEGVNGRLNRAVLPVATYMCATQPLPDQIEGLLPYKGCLSDTRRAGDYFRRGPENRLLWGGRITTRRSSPTDLTRLLKQDIAQVFPALDDVPVSHTWMGLMGYCVHKMPLISALEPGMWVNTAFGGHGLNTTGIGGQVVAEAITKDTDRIRLFEPFKARWGGGPLGRIATQLLYWRMRLQDKVAEI